MKRTIRLPVNILNVKKEQQKNTIMEIEVGGYSTPPDSITPSNQGFLIRSALCGHQKPEGKPLFNFLVPEYVRLSEIRMQMK